MVRNEVCSAAVLESLDFPVIKELLSGSTHSEATLKLVDELRPIANLKEIEYQLRLVTEMRKIHDDGERFPIDTFESIEKEIAVLNKEGAILQPTGLANLGIILVDSRIIKTFLKNRIEKQPGLYALSDNLISFPMLEKKVSKTVGADGEILDSASPELRKIRKSISNAENRMRKRLEEMMGRLVKEGIAREGNPTIRNGRFVIPIKVGYKRQVHGIIHDSSSSGTTVFIEPMEVVEISNEVQELRNEEAREIERILKELTAEFVPYAGDISQAFDALTIFDLIYAKAVFSKSLNACAPKILKNGSTAMKSARNPVLEQHRKVVPLEFIPGADIKTVVITGPNAGGKTVALKTVGLLTAMAQSGLHIPVAEDSSVVVFDKIFADIGDKQSISEDLSTFTSHMRNLKEMFDNADSKSLLLIDEIGTGTDPAEGAALSAAFLLDINERGAITIVTTHHSSLKAVAQETKGFLNCSMEFDAATLSPSYKFLKGTPGSSYAFEISKKIGLNKKLIQKAESILGSDAVNVNQLISKLERERQKLRKMENEANRAQSQLDKMVSKYDVRLKESESLKKKSKAEAAREAKSILAEANSTIEKAIREIRESNADAEVVREVRKNVQGQKNRVESLSLEEENPESGGSVPLNIDDAKKGMYVSIPSLNVTGTISELLTDKNEAVVSVGSTSLRINVGKLTKLSDDKIQAASVPTIGYGGPKPRDVGYEISLRGMRAEEALSVLEKYLDDAILAGFSRVEIVHGRGEGILKKIVAEQLEAHPNVKGFHTPPPEKGGVGVTVVELK